MDLFERIPLDVLRSDILSKLDDRSLCDMAITCKRIMTITKPMISTRRAHYYHSLTMIELFETMRVIREYLDLFVTGILFKNEWRYVRVSRDNIVLPMLDYYWVFTLSPVKHQKVWRRTHSNMYVYM